MSSKNQLLNLQVCRSEKKDVTRFIHSLLQSVYEQMYNIWCCICLYTLGAYYMMVEVNRKLDWFSMVRKLDANRDLPQDMSDLSCIVTGGSRGIGWETARTLLMRGARVIIATSVKPGPGLQQLNHKLIQELRSDDDHDANDQRVTGADRLELWHLDLGSFDSVIDFVHRFRATGRDVNVLINNAGQMYSPFRVTENGFESHWEVNYLSHCLLIALLLPDLRSAAKQRNKKSRIVNVASSTHYCRNLNFNDLNGFHMYSPFHAYAQSKLAQIMFTYKLHRLLISDSNDQTSDVSVNCLHPGVAKTELYENVRWVRLLPFVADLLFRTAKEGSETVMFVATSPELEGVSGKYFEDLRVVESSSFSSDRRQQDRLWDLTVRDLKPALEKYLSSVKQVSEKEHFIRSCPLFCHAEGLASNVTDKRDG